MLNHLASFFTGHHVNRHSEDETPLLQAETRTWQPAQGYQSSITEHQKQLADSANPTAKLFSKVLKNAMTLRLEGRCGARDHQKTCNAIVRAARMRTGKEQPIDEMFLTSVGVGESKKNLSTEQFNFVVADIKTQYETVEKLVKAEARKEARAADKARRKLGLVEDDRPEIDASAAPEMSSQAPVDGGAAMPAYYADRSVMRVSGQRFSMRRYSRRMWPAISAPDGVLPVRSSIATGRPVAVS